MTSSNKLQAALLLAAFFASSAASPALANPVFSHAESGSVRIEENGAVYDIHSADRSIGAFTSFSNVPGETINSFQASPEHTALFRVVGGEPSQILGALNANSRIFLVNPNGILFGPGSNVNAPGLVASALGISNADFLAGDYAFGASDAAGGLVVNQGALHGGHYVVLLGRAVRNDGVIRSGGAAALAAGDSARLLLDSEGLVSIDVTAAVSAPVDGASDAVANAGLVSADGGAVLLTARSAEGLFDGVINHSGVAEARTVGVANGVVTLDGGEAGIVRVSGVIDASGGDEGEKGGTAHVLGEKVGLFGEARVDVSGDSGGGTALLGGDYRGENPGIANASFTYAASGATVDARAVRHGDGGKVVAWADDATRFHGSIDVRGGALSGDGGFAETSGKKFLDVEGIRVTASASGGAAGTWLLDPEDIEIQMVTANVNDVTDGDDRTFSPSMATATLSSATVSGALDAGTNVLIHTETTGSGNGDITVNSAIVKTAANDATLRLEAAGSIVLNDTITMNGGSLTLSAEGAINAGAGSSAGDGVADLIVNDNVTLLAQQIGNVHQLEIGNTDAAGDQSLAVYSLAESTNQNVNLEVIGDNFNSYLAIQTVPDASFALDLPGSDQIQVTGGASTAALAAILDQGAVEPDFTYSLAEGDAALASVTLGTAASLTVQAVDGSIVDATSFVAAESVSFLSAGDVGNGAGAIKINADTVTAISGGEIDLELISDATLGFLAAEDGVKVESAFDVTASHVVTTIDDDASDILISTTSGDVFAGYVSTGGAEGDVAITASGSILDDNGDALNFEADGLSLDAAAGTVGESTDALEATFGTFTTTNDPTEVFLTEVVPGAEEIAGLQIVGGRITGGENIAEFTTSLYGEQSDSEESGSGDSKEEEEAATESAAAAASGEAAPVEEPAGEEPAPVDQQTFSPCGV